MMNVTGRLTFYLLVSYNCAQGVVTYKDIVYSHFVHYSVKIKTSGFLFCAVRKMERGGSSLVNNDNSFLSIPSVWPQEPIIHNP